MSADDPKTVQELNFGLLNMQDASIRSLELQNEMLRNRLKEYRLMIVTLGDSLISMLNIEKAAIDGAEQGLDVPYHFDKARKALKSLRENMPQAYEDAIS